MAEYPWIWKNAVAQRVESLIQYNQGALRRDVVAALTVAAISLPQGMAYALLAGVDPGYGLFSAIVVTFVAAIFSSSSHLINGPTSAISLVVLAALSIFGPDQRAEAAEAMFLLGIMVGTIQIVIAVLGLGDLTRYISGSVLLGFMSAAAFLLAVGQVGNALGVREKGSGAENIFLRLGVTLTTGDPINIRAGATAVATLLLALLARRLVQRYRLPRFDMLAVLVAVTLVTWFAGWTIPDANGKTLIGTVGAVPNALPMLHIPDVTLSRVLNLAPDSFAIALLGLLEALAIAKAIATQTRQPLDYNRQCLAEGLGNLAGGFFRCLPGSGSLSRSAINFQAGAATRVSGLLTAVFVAISVLIFAPLARFVPRSVLAALLILTASRLIDINQVAYTLRASQMDAIILGVTAAVGLALGLDQAILAGVALSLVLFVLRAARLKTTELVVDAADIVREKAPYDPLNHGFLMFDLEGELFFGAAPELERMFADIERRARAQGVLHVLIRLKRVRNPDVVSLRSFEDFLRQARKNGLTVWLAGLRPDLLEAFQRLDFLALVPEVRVFPQGIDEDSATLAAIRGIRSALNVAESMPSDRLYYLV